LRIRTHRLSGRALEFFLVVLFLQLAAFPQTSLPAGATKGRDHRRQQEQWFRRGRSISGKNAAALRYRAYQQKMRLRSTVRRQSRTRTQAAGSGSGPQWQNLGPAPIISDPTGVQNYGFVSGRATRVLVDQSDPTGSTVYVGGAFGGLWKSTNAAARPVSAVSWTPLLDDQPTLSVGAIAIEPDNNQVLLVGTGESNSSGDSYYGLGILRSADGGATWNLITAADAGAHPFKGLGFSRIVFSSDNPSLVVASTVSSNGTFLGATGPNTTLGLYYSSDAGVSWNLASVTDSSAAITPGSTTSVVYNSALHAWYAAVRFHGMYSSSDGMHWSRLLNQPGGSIVSSSACPASTLTTCPFYRGELALAPGSATLFLWFVDANDGDHGIFESTDGGANWTTFSVAGITSCGDSDGCGTEQGGYNLALAALPTATGVDLYAGAVNLFKCSISTSNPTCGAAGSWKNLTHVYGCNPEAAPSHIHPDQHDIAFSFANPNVMYFANDGGIYATVNSSGMTSGSCSAPNPFDDLNGTLGSMTQFVSISLNPLDVSTVLGGTQDNGSPAVDASHSGSNGVTWSEVVTGDGGFNAINPSNPLEWFAANSDVSIQRCTSGINCTQSLFKQVVGQTQVGGDHGDFYTPYLLDPQATSSLIVGTCRVWRGHSSGQGWSQANALSGSLTGDTLPCSGSNSLVISAVAAGGPLGATGSKLIYAGTSAGQLWVTTNGDQDPPTWTQGSIAANGFPVSDIALDPTDPTGLSAYATVMGFGVGHVFKTGNGTYWQDVSGNLPDAPANAVLVDPGDPNIIYVGTDVGVFISSDAGASWSEYGPNATSGPGFLPDTPSTRLRAYVDASTRRLRASTYGRGVWEIDMPAVGPDFVIHTTLPNIAAYPGQTATFNGALASVNGYASSVVMSCNPGTGSVPATCTGTSVTPVANGAPFAISVSNATIGNFSFSLAGTGSDASATTRQAAVLFQVVDFALQPPQSSVSVSPGASITLPVLTLTAAGSFSGQVTITCDPSTLPANTSCSSTTVSPNAAYPVKAVITLATTSVTPVGSYNVSLVATANDPAGTRTQAITVNVVPAATDFTISQANSAAPIINRGQAATFNISVTPQSGSFTAAVTFACSNLPRLTTCNFSPSTLSAGSNGGSTLLTVQTTAPGTAALLPGPRRNSAAPLYALWMAGPWGILVLGGKRRRTRRSTAMMLLLLLLAAGILVAGCGGGAGNVAGQVPNASSGTPPGTYTVTVQATSGTFSHSTNVTFTVQ
jgi:hypothetical protein